MSDSYGITPGEAGDIARLGPAPSALDVILEEREHYKDLAERQGQELAQIRACMSEIAVYEGLVDVSPLVMLVSELVSDHEELERRIDEAIMRIRSGPSYGLGDDLAQILQGLGGVPDTPEGL